jgi:hypothetical protein
MSRSSIIVSPGFSRRFRSTFDDVETVTTKHPPLDQEDYVILLHDRKV